jgi:hypothetical protein
VSTLRQMLRFNVQFPSTQMAENFHNGIGYVTRVDPVKLAEVGKTYDGKTVIVYTPYYTRKEFAAEAKKWDGRVVGVGRVAFPTLSSNAPKPGSLRSLAGDAPPSMPPGTRRG